MAARRVRPLGQAARDGERGRAFELGGKRILHATGKIQSAQALADCEGALLIVNVTLDTAGEGCLVIDLAFLRRNGSVAISTSDHGLRIVTARDVEGVRLWSQ